MPAIATKALQELQDYAYKTKPYYDLLINVLHIVIRPKNIIESNAF